MIDVATTLAAPTHRTLLAVMAHQRRLLEQLLYRYSELSMLIEAGEHRFLARAVDEVLEVEEDLAAADLMRAGVVDDLVPGRSDPTLHDVLDTAPVELRPELERMGERLHHLMRQLTVLKEAAHLRTDERLAKLEGARRRLDADGYRSDGSPAGRG